jgi:hypothetical protein
LPRREATPKVDRDDEEPALCPEEPDELWLTKELDELEKLWLTKELDELEKLLLWDDPELEEPLELEPPEDECCAKTAEVNNRTTGTARPESLI